MEEFLNSVNIMLISFSIQLASGSEWAPNRVGDMVGDFEKIRNVSHNIILWFSKKTSLELIDGTAYDS